MVGHKARRIWGEKSSKRGGARGKQGAQESWIRIDLRWVGSCDRYWYPRLGFLNTEKTRVLLREAYSSKGMKCWSLPEKLAIEEMQDNTQTKYYMNPILKPVLYRFLSRLMGAVQHNLTDHDKKR